MKGELHYDSKGQLQCRRCHELEKKRGFVSHCQFCSRMRYIDAMKPDDRPRDKPKK